MSESELKVNGRCDFCALEEAKHTINGGLWWICDKCMEQQFGCPVTPNPRTRPSSMGGPAPKAGQSAKTLSPVGGEEE